MSTPPVIQQRGSGAQGGPESGGESASCTECPIAGGRREFLREAGLAALAVVASVAGASRLAAEQVRFIEATASSATTHNYAIPAADGVSIDKKNEVILVRWHNAVYAFNLACPHENTALKWDDGANRFQCPKHHSRYEPDGTFIDGRATRGMDRFAITKLGSDVVVDLDKLFQQDKETTQWTAAMIRIL